MAKLDNPESIIESFKEEDNKGRLKGDLDRYVVYNGRIKDLIKRSIKKEFLLEETVGEMINRIVPLNVTKKVTDKLATVYKDPPIRFPVDRNDGDQELIDFYAKEWKLNKKLKHANSMFKLHKNVALEPFLSSKGVPKIRVLPSHTFTVMSDDPIDPTEPTILTKIIRQAEDPREERFVIWTNENHWLVDGEGAILRQEMEAMNNPDGINPFGKLPFVYIRDSEDLLIPISDDDLLAFQLILGLLLTDLTYASKYQAFSLFVLLGAESNRFSFNPNSIIELPEGADFKTVKPNLDSDAMVRMVKELAGMLLSTKGLKSSGVQIDGENAVSGISKMLDSAESVEIREDQIDFFRCAEQELWPLFGHTMLPYWMEQGNINPDFGGKFSEDFELGIIYPELKPLLGKKEILDLEIRKLNSNLTTKKDAVKALNPEFTDEEVEAKLLEINKEAVDRANFFERNLLNGEDEATDRPNQSTAQDREESE